MSKSTDYHQYTYRKGQPLHTHRYLWTPVLGELKRLGISGTVWDAGCGNGAATDWLMAQGFDTRGFDLSESGIAQARQDGNEARYKLHSVYEDFTGLFDPPPQAIVSLEVVEHLFDPKLFIRNCFAALPPGGYFVASTPYHGYLKNLALAVMGQMDKHFTATWDGGHIKFWSAATLGSVLTEAGFTSLHFVGAGRFPYLWKSMIISARKPA